MDEIQLLVDQLILRLSVFSFLQDKNGAVNIGDHESKFRLIPDRPSKREIKPEPDVKQEFQQKIAFQKIRVGIISLSPQTVHWPH